MRPQLNLVLSPAAKKIETWSIGLLLALWIVSVICIFSLPNIVPTHFNLSGQVDGCGSKEWFLLLPCITTILFIGLKVLGRYPHKYNYLVTITEKNALKEYTSATGMIRVVNLSAIILNLVLQLILLFATSTSEACI